MRTATKILAWMTESLDEFTEQLSLSKSRTTVDAYRYDVSRFLEYVHDKNIRRISTLKPQHIISYLGFCKSHGKSDSSIHRYYMSIRSFCRYLRRIKAIQFDLTEDITPPMNKQKAPRVPTIEEVEKILKQPDIETESGTRDRAILELLYSSGLRASELCDLELKDVQEKQILVTCGKRGKTRSVPITNEACVWIKLYIQAYRGKEAGYLFQTCMGKQIRRQLLCRIVSEYANAAGIEGITTHCLRHACATHLLSQGADLRMIQEVLGHSSINSTQRYTHLTSEKIHSMFDQFHPRKSNAVLSHGNTE